MLPQTQFTDQDKIGSQKIVPTWNFWFTKANHFNRPYQGFVLVDRFQGGFPPSGEGVVSLKPKQTKKPGSDFSGMVKGNRKYEMEKAIMHALGKDCLVFEINDPLQNGRPTFMLWKQQDGSYLFKNYNCTLNPMNKDNWIAI